ncbi:MAG TPA: GGDEF domain-containing protein [Rhizomicrobium sp.]|nr:GGDEF domain-containing protein [Rhizomicrobium sp.]
MEDRPIGVQIVQNREREQAVAKATLALMADADVSPTPANYELFHAYASGEKAGAAAVIGEMLASRKRFTTTILADLHERASKAARTQTVVSAIGEELADMLSGVLENIEAAGRDAEAYGQKLSAASDQLGGSKSPPALQKLVDGLIDATQSMEDRTKALEDELQRSSLEVTELRTQLDHVRKESLTDPLTNVQNRKAFDDELANAIASANETGNPLSLMMCDIDHFKTFNDTWGHQTGDHVLRLVAGCLSENVKGRDTVARYGGEEFAVILRHTSLTQAMSLAEQIRQHVERKKLVKKSTGDILGMLTISIGVAQFVASETDADLIRRADTCLYAAKRAGRNRVIGEKDPRVALEGVVAA